MMSILNLPEEIYDVIFARLSLGDVFNYMQVCKKWYYILERGNSELWQYHNFKTAPPLEHERYCKNVIYNCEILSSLSSHKSRLKAFKYAWNLKDCSFHNYISSYGFMLTRYSIRELNNSLLPDYRLDEDTLRDRAKGKS